MPTPPPTHAVIKKQADPSSDSTNCDCAGCASVLDMLVRRELGETDGDGIGLPRWKEDGDGFSPSLVRRNARDGIVLPTRATASPPSTPVDGSHSISRWWRALLTRRDEEHARRRALAHGRREPHSRRERCGTPYEGSTCPVLPSLEVGQCRLTDQNPHPIQAPMVSALEATI